MTKPTNMLSVNVSLNLAVKNDSLIFSVWTSHFSILNFCLHHMLENHCERPSKYALVRKQVVRTTSGNDQATGYDKTNWMQGFDWDYPRWTNALMKHQLRINFWMRRGSGLQMISNSNLDLYMCTTATTIFIFCQLQVCPVLLLWDLCFGHCAKLVASLECLENDHAKEGVWKQSHIRTGATGAWRKLKRTLITKGATEREIPWTKK